jgi:hypothetical protein
MAIENVNRISAQCILSINSPTDHGFVNNQGFASLIRNGVGDYTLIPESLLDYRTGGTEIEMRQVPRRFPLDGNNAECQVFAIPIDAPASPGVVPGSVSLLIADADGDPADVGFMMIDIVTFASQQ